MSYCTLADIEKRRIATDTLIQLTDDDNLGVINATTVAGVIQDATILVEGYLRGRYALPLNPVPDLAASITADLAAWGCYALKPQFDIPDAIKDRRNTALALLARIQDGKMKLYEDTTAPASNTPAASFSGPDRIFSRDKMRGL